MDFSLTDDQELLRDTATKLLERECPPALVRAHIDDPSVYEPLWRHLREFTALGAGPATDLCLFLEQTGYVAAPGPFLATALLHVTRPATTATTTGTVAFLDDPMNPFVLEADRVEQIAIVGPGPTRRGRRHRRRRRPAALRLARSTSPAACSTLDAADLDARRRSRSTPSAFAAWRDRATSRSRPR